MSSSTPHHQAEQNEEDRDTVKNEITIRPRGLSIVWGNDDRYWRLPDKGKRDAPAELAQVSWLEVTGSADVPKDKNYEIGFNISLKADAFGWSGCPVFMMAKIGKRGRYMWRKMKPLDQIETFPADIPQEKFRILVPNGRDGGQEKLYFGLYEVWNGKWKGGLQIHHAFIREVT